MRLSFQAVLNREPAVLAEKWERSQTTSAGKRRRKEKQSVNLLSLPPDILIQIFTRLEHDDRLSLSVVCKSFRSLANGFVHKLSFYKGCLPSDSALQKLFHRFSSVSRVSIRSNRIIRALTAIVNTGLKIECLEIYGKHSFPKACGMASLSPMLRLVRCLKFQWLSNNVGESEIVDFIHLFESLEELDLSVRAGSSRCFEWSDVGIEDLVLKCPNLRKVKLNDNNCLTARSLYVFASCVNLEHISVAGCFLMNLLHIWAFLQKAKGLKSLELSEMREQDYLTLAKIVPACENLSHLFIKGANITDDFLLAIANLCPRLTSLEFKPDLHGCNTYTMTGVSAMIRAFQGLTRLHAYLPWPGSNTHDTEMSKLVKFLPCLKDVFLLLWSPAYTTLFSLIQNCLLLERIYIKSMHHSTLCDVPNEIRKNYSIQCIYLDPWPGACVQTALNSSCPSLKILM